MGIINYCHQFIVNFSTITELLRQLRNQKTRKKESEIHEAFHRLTKKLTSAEILSYYNPIAETNIKVDTGPKGLGAILSQKQKNGR